MNKDYAILKFDLVESIPAYEFYSIISMLEGIYGTFLWLDKSDDFKEMPMIYYPKEDEKLYINRVDIGTPNIIEFIGIAEHLINAAHFLSINFNTILAVGSAAFVAIEKTNTLLDVIEKVKGAIKEEDEIVIENEELKKRIKFMEVEMEKLKKANKISKAVDDMKSNYINSLKSRRNYTENIVTKTSIILIKSKLRSM